MTAHARCIMAAPQSAYWACFDGADGKSIEVAGFKIELENGSPSSRARRALVNPLWRESDLEAQLRILVGDAVGDEQ